MLTAPQLSSNVGENSTIAEGLDCFICSCILDESPKDFRAERRARRMERGVDEVRCQQMVNTVPSPSLRRTLATTNIYLSTIFPAERSLPVCAFVSISFGLCSSFLIPL
ncbi:hypothetical protein V3C99_013532 [Haemonchus contortus]